VVLVRTGSTPRLFASRPDRRVPPLPRGRRGRTAHPRGSRGRRPAGDARAVRGRVFRKYACIQRCTLFIPPRHQPASSLRPPGTSQRPRSSLLRGRQCAVRGRRARIGRTGHRVLAGPRHAATCAAAGAGARRGTHAGLFSFDNVGD
jgi:hypothetical protein